MKQLTKSSVSWLSACPDLSSSWYQRCPVQSTTTPHSTTAGVRWGGGGVHPEFVISVQSIQATIAEVWR